MRKITQQEAEQWIALAEAHGFTDSEGRFALGRFVVEGRDDEGHVLLRVITPIPAGLYTEALRKKTPPILFDRTPAGEIILPGRWWQHMFEGLSAHEEVPEATRQAAAAAAATIAVPDVYLPADTDTIEITAPDADGEPVTHEALPPGGVMRLRLTPRPAA